MHEIAVRAVQLQHVETSFMRAPRRVAPGLHQVFHLAPLQRLRHRPFLAVGDARSAPPAPGVPILDIGRPLQRAVALPRPCRARLAAGMAELNAGDRILLLDEFDEAAERFDEGIVPDAEIADRAAAAPLDLGQFHDHEAGAAGGELAGVHQVPVGRKALHRRILMHRRHHDAVLQRHAADRHRGKQQRFRHVGFLASGHHCPGMPLEVSPGSVFYFCFAAPSADLAFGLAGGALAAAFGGALSLRTVPQGSRLLLFRYVAERPPVGPLGVLLGRDFRRRLGLVLLAISGRTFLGRSRSSQ